MAAHRHREAGLRATCLRLLQPFVVDDQLPTGDEYSAYIGGLLAGA